MHCTGIIGYRRANVSFKADYLQAFLDISFRRKFVRYQHLSREDERENAVAMTMIFKSPVVCNLRRLIPSVTMERLAKMQGRV